MQRLDKRALLRKLLRGDTNGLQALKQDQQRISGIVIVDRMPDEWSNEQVHASYTLNNGTKVEKKLAYAEIMAKARNSVLMLPCNHR
ncbi:hypothetical protein [Larkinella terrae]|uniref:Uncharacterized protein n=1 Tax=Larkinella terrae TaxID=2025311 RepID=A0A7K0ENI3_9BACT|nr:hypothetical protein [Larkinella terrae]MRS63364.1 hypothetical protein [Larkinella terrae]